MTLSTFIKFFLPGSLILGCAIIFLNILFFSSFVPMLLSVFPYAVFFVGLFMGWRFSRSRLIFTIIILALVDRTLLQLPQMMENNLVHSQLIYHTIIFLLPLNIMLMGFIRERGIFTLHGVIRIGIIVLQPLILYLIVRLQKPEILSLLSAEFLSIHFLDTLSIPQPAILMYVVALIFLVVNFVLKEDILESGFVWALMSTFFAFLAVPPSAISTLYFSTAGFILIMSTVEYSHNVAFRDDLTGLPTRRSLNEVFLKLPNRYSITMIDVDHFKKFNDRYGHDVGDQVLRKVSSCLLSVSGGGKAYRYGGEEFAIIFPGKTCNETRPHIETLLKTIANTPFSIRSSKRPITKPENVRSAPRSGKKAKITVSAGIAERNEKNVEALDVLKAADKALLRAKKAGRNCVRVFGKSN